MFRRFLLTGALVFAAASPAWAQKQLVDRVVAVVNDEPITQSELDLYLRPVYKELKQQYREEELAKEFDAIRLKLLNQMIEDRLVFQEAKARNITVEESEVDEMIAEFKKRFPSEEEFEKARLGEGFSLNELRENYKRQLTIRKLHDMEIRARVVISPLEIETYYRDHLPELSEKQSVKLSSITVKKSDEAQMKGLADEDAKKRVETIEKQLQEGQDFGKLAHRFSEDTRAKESGSLGWMKRGEMLSSIEGVLFELKPGEVSPVLETASAYHIFKVEEKKGSRTPSLDEVREKIHEILFRQKAQERFNEWMSELKGRAYITIR